jgi:hypothetical protein
MRPAFSTPHHLTLPHQMKNPLRLLAATAATYLLASCAGTQGTVGQTQYLDAFAPGSVPVASQQITDTVSYWDGENMSGAPSVVLDLSEQKAYFYKGGQLAGMSAICSGDDKHPTIPGNFKVIQKDKYHKSNLYGDYVDGAGNVVMKDIDVNKDRCPPGCHFDGSKMTHFMRFNGGAGMHEGYMAGYPASHGCVRMPAHMAEIFFHNVSTGTPVRVQP